MFPKLNYTTRTPSAGQMVAAALIVGASVFSAQAATIGIVDSGNDFLHRDLSSTAWRNAGETAGDGVDNDQNGFADDINGWNFAENNAALVDRSMIGTFSPDVFRFFEVQDRTIRGTATEADRNWMTSRRQDQSFLEQLNKFGNFAHGTHVQGISTKDIGTNKMMGLKLIGGSAAAMFRSGMLAGMRHYGIESMDAVGPFQDVLVRYALRSLAGRQGQAMAPIADYLARGNAQVANCSFGIGFKQALPLIEQLLTQFGITPTPEEIETYTAFFINEILASQATNFTGRSANTLFVMAAGNDNSDNDTKPSAPTNIQADNVISVAATIDRYALAPFSNFGASKVDVAAPGVGIFSTVPGDAYVHMSGTSQAAPYVSRAAGLVIDANPALTVVQVKQILKGTVDVKDWLRGRVVTSGIVNPQRAERAARLSQNMSVEQAIRQSQYDITDLSVNPSIRPSLALDIVPVALSPLFN